MMGRKFFPVRVDAPSLAVLLESFEQAPLVRCPCPWQRGWNLVIFKVISNSNHCMVLWLYKAALSFDSDHKTLPLPSGIKRKSHCRSSVSGIFH